MASTVVAQPLRLRPVFDQKPWGGRRLERFGKQLPPGPIGESHETGADATVDGGPFDGMTLAELARHAGEALLGARGMVAAAGFDDVPLLVKFIDASQDLSVQVHPDDAAAPPGKRGKTEAWLILDAEPGSSLVVGLEGESVTLPEIERQLVREPVQPGDVFFVPAGTVHAIGAGVLLYEVQQASDVTWRLYDWGRPRPIQVDEALAVARIGQRARRTVPARLDATRELLVACPYFVLERWQVAGATELPPFSDSLRVLTVVEGDLICSDVTLPLGTTAILPADMPPGELRGHGMALLSYIPNLDRDVVQPLRAAGYADAVLRQIGDVLP